MLSRVIDSKLQPEYDAADVLNAKLYGPAYVDLPDPWTHQK